MRGVECRTSSFDEPQREHRPHSAQLCGGDSHGDGGARRRRRRRKASRYCKYLCKKYFWYFLKLDTYRISKQWQKRHAHKRNCQAMLFFKKYGAGLLLKLWEIRSNLIFEISLFQWRRWARPPRQRAPLQAPAQQHGQQQQQRAGALGVPVRRRWAIKAKVYHGRREGRETVQNYCVNSPAFCRCLHVLFTCGEADRS